MAHVRRNVGSLQIQGIRISDCASSNFRACEKTQIFREIIEVAILAMASMSMSLYWGSVQQSVHGKSQLLVSPERSTTGGDQVWSAFTASQPCTAEDERISGMALYGSRATPSSGSRNMDVAWGLNWFNHQHQSTSSFTYQQKFYRVYL